MDKPFRLPLFPLHTVLFPDQPIPLRVFEPRYLLMVEGCLKEERHFGVVLIREGLEVHGPAIPYSVGTTAKIARHRRVGRGQIQLTAIGQHRFRILEIVNLEPYMEASVVLWPWLREPAPSPGLVESVGEWLRRYVGALADTVPDVLSPQTLPQDATTLGILAAVILRVSLAEKQALLQTPTARALLTQTRALLRRQTYIAEQIRERQPVGPQEFKRISWN